MPKYPGRSLLTCTFCNRKTSAWALKAEVQQSELAPDPLTTARGKPKERCPGKITKEERELT